MYFNLTTFTKISHYPFQTNDFKQQKRHLDEKLARKESELDIVQHELNQIKDFRKRKAQMEKELDEV